MRHTIPILFLLAAVAAPALAQDAEPSPHVDLARVCTSELGLDFDPVECAAIHSVLDARANKFRVTFSEMARRYSGRVFDTSRRGVRAWLPHLPAEAREGAESPEHWPWGMSWPDVGLPGWRANLEAARGILSGSITHRCESQPHHWGMRGGNDLRRARGAIRDGRWYHVRCVRSDGSRTRNMFFGVRGFEGRR